MGGPKEHLFEEPATRNRHRLHPDVCAPTADFSLSSLHEKPRPSNFNHSPPSSPFTFSVDCSSQKSTILSAIGISASPLSRRSVARKGFAFDLVDVQPQPLHHLLSDLMTSRRVQASQPQRPRETRHVWRDRVRAPVQGWVRQRVRRVRLTQCRRWCCRCGGARGGGSGSERRVGSWCGQGQHWRYGLPWVRADVRGQMRFDEGP